MSIEDWIEKIAVAVAVMFFVIFIAFIGYICWAEATADTIILRDDGQSYACQTSPLRRSRRHILRDLPLLRIQAGRAQADRHGSSVWHDRRRILQAIREHVMEDKLAEDTDHENQND